MKKLLRDYFPVLRDKEEIKKIIDADSRLRELWNQWELPQQEVFMNWCSGARGVKILYDSFFKEIMNPEYTPERLNTLLSFLLQKQVTVLKVLPNDSTRIAAEHSLLIMDIVVELEDGSIADVEVQKIGYAFTGQRSACYSSDLLLRQYKRVKDEKGKSFKYNDIKSVYTIVFMETSAGEFHQFPDTYIHYFEQQSNTGMKLNLLQKFVFVPLDIFKKNYHNKGIQNELDAWLVFLSIDEPEVIIQLIIEHPEFKMMYEDIYQLCLNVERVMEMFSKELELMDKNTVIYMMDEMQREIDEKDEELEKKDEELTKKDEELIKKDVALKEKEIQIKQLQEQLLKLQS